jgi:hypothetical protein
MTAKTTCDEERQAKHEFLIRNILHLLELTTTLRLTAHQLKHSDDCCVLLGTVLSEVDNRIDGIQALLHARLGDQLHDAQQAGVQEILLKPQVD